jgi:predicted metal-binding membrane protein
MSAAGLESVLKRDRWVLLATLTGLLGVAWGYMVHEARGMSVGGVCCCAGMKMSGPDMNPWSISVLPPLFLMWAEMMVAMMLPSATPMLLTFASVNRKRREQERPFVPTGVFALGYLAVWTGFSALAAISQWALHGFSLLSPMMVSQSPIFAGALLIGAGVFQWTTFKDACLAQCRSPLGLLLNDWREGKAGAFAMGLRHGLYCTGCCWFLMALLFVAGVMNLWWVGLLTVFVLIEKAAPRRWRVGGLAGAILVAWGLVTVSSALKPH